MNVFISIIMPAYNSEKYISKAIESVINQTYPNWELIIVNDCSKDSTMDIAKKYAELDNRIKVFSNEKNLGVTLTRKKAIIESSYNYIAFLDSDDLWLPQKLEIQVASIKGENCLVFTGSGFVDENDNYNKWKLHVPSTITYKKVLKQNLISNSSVLIDKQLFINNMCMESTIHEDFATWIKVLKKGVIAIGIDEPLLTYRLSKNSKSGNKIKAAKMNYKTYRYVGFCVIKSLYYMFFYMILSIKKYKQINKGW